MPRNAAGRPARLDPPCSTRALLRFSLWEALYLPQASLVKSSSTWRRREEFSSRFSQGRSKVRIMIKGELPATPHSRLTTLPRARGVLATLGLAPQATHSPSQPTGGVWKNTEVRPARFERRSVEPGRPLTALSPLPAG